MIHHSTYHVSEIAAPAAVFLFVCVVTCKEGTLFSRETKYRLAIICGWLFLVLPALKPVMIMGVHYGMIYVQMSLAACLACSFGMALTALRLRAPRPQAAVVLLIVSGAILVILLYNIYRAAYID